MVVSALVVKVPEAELVVGPLRERFDVTSQRGLPAHITILFPFMHPDKVTPDVLKRLQMALVSVPAFSFSLTSVKRFDVTAYLAPVPAEPFISMTASVVRHFPEFQPYGGAHREIIPHLTVANGDAHHAAVAATELTSRLNAYPAIQARCDAVTLIENASGRWEDMHVFELRR